MKNKILLIIIIFLAVFLRFYLLGAIPSGLTNDEAGVGWDAYSILHTGKDQWNQFLPLHFIAFGDYPPPMMRYITVPSIAVFGLNAFATRFPSALFGVFSVGLMFLLAKKLFNEKVGIVSAFLMAISPWMMGLSRVTIDPNVGISFFILGLLLYIMALKQIKFLYLSSLFFALAIYTYSAYVLFIPLVALALLIWNFKHVKTHFKIYMMAILLFAIILIPNFLTKNTASSVRLSQVGLTTNINSIGLINILNDERGSCQALYNNNICKIADNKIVVFTSTFIKNYTGHFNIDLLYNSGTTTQFSILPERGLEYIFELVFLILGLATIIKRKDRNGYLLIGLLLIAPIPDALTSNGHYGRASLMAPWLLLIEGLGFFTLLKLISNISITYIRRGAYLLLSLIIFTAVLIFWINYTTYFKNNYSVYSQYGYESLMKQVYAERNSYDKIYISRHFNDTKQYIYYLFYNQYDPVKFQNKINASYSMDSDGWMSIDKIDNIYFVQNIPPIPASQSTANDRVLIVSAPVDFPKAVKPVFTIKDKLGNVLFKAVNLSDLIKYGIEQGRINYK